MQPTSQLHIGNYLGALDNWVKLQNTSDCVFCIVDLHALTVFQKPQSLRDNTREVAAGYLAAGLDPKCCIIFVQSALAEHGELAWILSCHARLGRLNRMTQFKEKAGPHRDDAVLGLYAYPVLMAADILLYKATHVPVGKDQKQHLELCREIATAFNHTYRCEFFPLPQPRIIGQGARVMSLRNGNKKMSKSDPSDYSRINLTDDADTITRKIRRAKTDNLPLPEQFSQLAGRAEAANLVTMFAVLSGRTPAEVVTEFAGWSFSKFKPLLAELALARLAPLSERMNQLKSDSGYLDQILAQGAERARALARPNIRQIRQLIGLST